jgi:hypothetical protein
MSHPIALVLDPGFGSDLLQLAQEMPVWVVASEANECAVTQARDRLDHAARVTTVFVRPGEALSDVCMRALYDIDEHHGPQSAGPEYREVRVYGATPNFVAEDVLRELGLSVASGTAHGFSLVKDRPPA